MRAGVRNDSSQSDDDLGAAFRNELGEQLAKTINFYLRERNTDRACLSATVRDSRNPSKVS